ncbi:MAG TPA: TatD family hydrolase [Polyangia bacterium]|jgi:TatD DNase family protein
MLIDCHAHLTADAFAADRDVVLARARAGGVAAILVVGEDLADDRKVAELTAARPTAAPALLPCFGFHPDRCAEDRPLPTRADLDAALQAIRAHASRLAAIGEVGLDGWVAKTDERRRAQESLLEELAAVALELGLPLNVHSRSAGERTLDLLRAAGARQVLMHAFDGRAILAVRAADEGYLFSIPPSVVRSPQKQKLVRRLPLASLALESDAPVLGPDPGQRNEPANLAVTRDYLASVHGVPPEVVEQETTANALRLFPRLGTVVAATRG